MKKPQSEISQESEQQSHYEENSHIHTQVSRHVVELEDVACWDERGVVGEKCGVGIQADCILRSIHIAPVKHVELLLSEVYAEQNLILHCV